MDNASTNDTLMDYIAADLEDVGIAYDARQHRLRCNSHIINLAFCAFLFGKHPDAEIQADGTTESRAGPFVRELTTWRKLGSLGKLHNIISYIMASPQRIQEFTQRSGGHLPRRDNKTWWNLWYMMLDWSLTKTRVLFFFSNNRYIN